MNKLRYLFYFFLCLFYISVCIPHANAQEEFDLRKHDLQPDTEHPLTAASIIRINYALRNNATFDLKQIEKLSPLLFKDSNVKQTFFTPGMSIVFLKYENGIVDNNVYAGDITRLCNGLMSHARNAVKRGEIKRAQHATWLAFDVATRALELEPPKIVTLEEEEKEGETKSVSFSGTAFYNLAVEPIEFVLVPTAPLLKSMQQTSPKNQAALQGCEAKLKSSKRALRKNNAEILDLLERGQTNTPRYGELWTQLIADLRPEVKALKECIKNAVVENVVPPKEPEAK